MHIYCSPHRFRLRIERILRTRFENNGWNLLYWITERTTTDSIGLQQHKLTILKIDLEATIANIESSAVELDTTSLSDDPKICELFITNMAPRITDKQQDNIFEYKVILIIVDQVMHELDVVKLWLKNDEAAR